jgi:adenine-specific DNA-methyltransferase
MKHAFARTLRREQTDVERKLWYALRGRRFLGFKFRRQQPIGPYIADFVCFEAKLVIELDGEQHGDDAHIAYDHARTERLLADGFRVLRFWNGELIENFEGVLEGIERALPSPLVGEEEKSRS